MVVHYASRQATFETKRHFPKQWWYSMQEPEPKGKKSKFLKRNPHTNSWHVLELTKFHSYQLKILETLFSPGALLWNSPIIQKAAKSTNPSFIIFFEINNKLGIEIIQERGVSWRYNAGICSFHFGMPHLQIINKHLTYFFCVWIHGHWVTGNVNPRFLAPRGMRTFPTPPPCPHWDIWLI